MENQTCPLHEVTMQAKEGAYGTYHSHIIHNVGFCNGKKITPFKDKSATQTTAAPQSSITREPIPQRDFYNENLGKCRFGLMVALVEKGGSEALKELDTNSALRGLINRVAEFAMNGEEL